MRLLKEYEPLLNAIFLSICEESHLFSEQPLKEILKHPKLLVAFNHSTPISWIPAICFLTKRVVDAGGGDRLAIGVADRFFFSNPVTRPLAKFLTQSETFRNFDNLLADFQKLKQMDLVIFPEGARTFFGRLDRIQRFRSPKFIELAIRAEVPILLAIHRGSESWNFPIPLPRLAAIFLKPVSSFFAKGIQKTGAINLPVKLNKISRFTMKLELYWPELKVDDLSPDWEKRKNQLDAEAEKIRERMQSLFEDQEPL